MTQRLYYDQSQLNHSTAQVIGKSPDGLRLVLEQTIFYPTSGGQPHDLGTIDSHKVVDVLEEDDQIVHVLDSPFTCNVGDTVVLSIDAARRRDHREQHTGQHLLSAVMAEQFGLQTVSFHMSAAYSTIDVEPPSATPEVLLQVETAANETLRRNLQVTASYEDASSAQGLRKPTDRTGTIRVITIQDLDRSACGGTHVGHTGEIGLILLGATEKVRNALRIEFFCGGRAIRQLRRWLHDSRTNEESLRQRLADVDKTRAKLARELAQIHGRERRENTPANLKGIKLWSEAVPAFTDELKTSAQEFVESPGCLCLLWSEQDGVIFFTAHPSLGIDCGKTLKPILQAAGGRGGGSAKFAQGNIADCDQLRAAATTLLLEWRD